MASYSIQFELLQILCSPILSLEKALYEIVECVRSHGVLKKKLLKQQLPKDVIYPKDVSNSNYCFSGLFVFLTVHLIL